MRFEGRVYRDGKYWLAEVPVLEAMTQGHTRREACEMVEDLVASLVDRPGFRAHVHRGRDGDFEVGGTHTPSMVSLLLRRQRANSGLSLAQVAERLGARSRNAYARYEQGVCQPTMDKLEELLRAVAPGRSLVLSQSDCAPRG